MLKKYKNKTLISISLGFLFIVISFILMSSEILYHWVLVYFYNALFIWGCYNWAKGKGYNGAWGLLGIFNIFGFIILAFFPDKHKSGAEISFFNKSKKDYDLSPGEAKIEFILNPDTAKKPAKKKITAKKPAKKRITTEKSQVRVKKLSEKKVKEMLLEQIGMVSPALKEVVMVTVVLDEPWNRYNCKFDVREITTHWQFLPILEKQTDFTARLKGFVETIILSLKMKGLNI